MFVTNQNMNTPRVDHCAIEVSVNCAFVHYLGDATESSPSTGDRVSKLSVVEKLLDTLQNAKENKVFQLFVCRIRNKTV